MKFNYEDHILEIEKGEGKYYCGFSDDLKNWWTLSTKDYKEIVDSFIKAVDNKLKGIVEEPAYYGLSYKKHILTVRKKGLLYTGTSTVYGRDWEHQTYDLDFLIKWFKSDVDRFSNDEELPKSQLSE